MGCVICSEREGEKERGARKGGGGAPQWPKRPPQREALAGEVAEEGGRVTSAPRKGSECKGGAGGGGGGGAGESWRRSGGGGGGRAAALGATWCVSGRTHCARSRRVLGPARPWKEGKENQKKKMELVR